MGVRGRKSGASLSVAVTNMPGQRPEPPSDLTSEQAAEWRAVVSQMPANWFTRETHAMLAQFCRHVVQSRVIAAQLDAFDPALLGDPDGLRRFDKLTQLADREGRAMSSLGTRMRLTQHARYTEKSAGSAAKHEVNGTRPWQRTG